MLVQEVLIRRREILKALKRFELLGGKRSYVVSLEISRKCSHVNAKTLADLASSMHSQNMASLTF